MHFSSNLLLLLSSTTKSPDLIDSRSFLLAIADRLRLSSSSVSTSLPLSDNILAFALLATFHRDLDSSPGSLWRFLFKFDHSCISPSTSSTNSESSLASEVEGRDPLSSTTLKVGLLGTVMLDQVEVSSSTSSPMFSTLISPSISSTSAPASFTSPFSRSITALSLPPSPSSLRTLLLKSHDFRIGWNLTRSWIVLNCSGADCSHRFSLLCLGNIESHAYIIHK